MVKQIESASIHLSLEEVAVCAAHEVLIESDNHILPSFCDFRPTAQASPKFLC